MVYNIFYATSRAICQRTVTTIRENLYVTLGGFVFSYVANDGNTSHVHRQIPALVIAV